MENVHCGSDPLVLVKSAAARYKIHRFPDANHAYVNHQRTKTVLVKLPKTLLKKTSLTKQIQSTIRMGEK